MTDIVERLRKYANEVEQLRDKIDRLRAENKHLRGALERAADALHDAQALDAWAQARKELEGKTNDTP